MTLKRIIVNVQTGEHTLVDLTPEEEALARAKTLEENTKPLPLSAAQFLVEQLKADPETLASLKMEILK